MYLLGLIKLFEQKGLLITLVNMLIARFGLKKKKTRSIQFVHRVSALVKRQNPRLQKLFQVHGHCYNNCGLHKLTGRDGGGWYLNNTTPAKRNLQASKMLPS